MTRHDRSYITSMTGLTNFLYVPKIGAPKIKLAWDGVV
jgi:hypothetical protein